SPQKRAGTEFELVVMNCAGQPARHARIWFDGEEQVWIHDGGKDLPFKEFETIIGNFSDGEFADFIVLDNEMHILAGTRICPKPIECKASDGAILSMQLKSPRGELYTLEGYGFKPNEILSITSKSEDEEIPPTTLEASSEGSLT